MVSYSLEDIKFEFKHKRINNAWLKMVAESEVKKLGNICIIFCSDNYILDDSVRENAEFYKTEFSDELNRVIVHGLLHLIGYDDHTEEEQKVMREKENYYLELRNHINN